jgi:pyruvate dehydrogenase E2 component (dihydrolipoamide acetyltransferase)
MAQPILVPQVGQDLTEAKIVELHVKLGDRVKKGDLVAVVESEKAAFEVEAFAEGVVISLPYKVDDWAPVLEPLMLLGSEGEVVAAAPVAAVAPVSVPVAVPAVAPVAVPVAPAVAAPAATEMTGPAPAASGLRASPAARLAATNKGLDVTRIAGTGPAGAVVLRDIAVAPALARISGEITLRTLQSGQGTPVIFIHGFGADLSAWRPLVGRINLGLPMLALDLPGHGGSTGQPAANFDDIVASIGDALRSVTGGIHLVGHSVGAAVAMALTARGDLDVRSLSLLSPAGLGPTVDAAFIEGFLAAQTEAALAAWMRRLVHDPAMLAPVLVRATLSARADAGLVPAQRQVARALFEGGTQLFSTAAALRAFPGPCTVVLGRDDAILSAAEVAAATPPQAALHRLPGVGHLPQVEAADLVVTLICRTIRAAG